MNSEILAKKTLAGILQYCTDFINQDNMRNKILNHIEIIMKDWSKSCTIIKHWLLEIEFCNKEQVLLNFIQRIPELQAFECVIHDMFQFHSMFWDKIYNNLFQCKQYLLQGQ